MGIYTKAYERKQVLCECDRRNGKLVYSRKNGYEYLKGCIKDAICSKIVVLKHKQWRQKNKKLEVEGEVTIYEG